VSVVSGGLVRSGGSGGSVGLVGSVCSTSRIDKATVSGTPYAVYYSVHNQHTAHELDTPTMCVCVCVCGRISKVRKLSGVSKVEGC
jgi:hypothetical protein